MVSALVSWWGWGRTSPPWAECPGTRAGRRCHCGSDSLFLKYRQRHNLVTIGLCHSVSVNKLLKTGGDATGETLMLLLGRIAAVNLSKEKNAHFSKRQITAHFKVELRAQNRIRSQSPHTPLYLSTLSLSLCWLVTSYYKLRTEREQPEPQPQ